MRKSVREMEALLLAEMRRLDDPYRLWDQPDDGLSPPPVKKRTPSNASPRKKPVRGQP